MDVEILHGLTVRYVVSRYHDDGTATFEQIEGVTNQEQDMPALLAAIYPGADIRRADCEHLVMQLFQDGKVTDTVWLAEAVPYLAGSE